MKGPNNTNTGHPRLAVGHGLARLEQDPDICANHIARAVPLRHLSPLVNRTPYRNRTYSLELEGVAISNGHGTPFQMQVEDQDRPSLLVSLGGQASIKLGGQVYDNTPDQPLFFLSGEAFGCSFLEANALIMSLDPTRLARTVMQMAERVQRDGIDLGRLQQPLVVDTGSWVSQHLARMLLTTLHLLDLSLQQGNDQPGCRAGISDMLCSQVAGLLYPSLLDPF